MSEMLGPAGLQQRKCVSNFIVGDALIIAKHHRPNGLRHHSNLNVATSKRLNGAQGLPQRNDLKFDSGGNFAAQDRCANKTWKVSELRKRFKLEVLNVSISQLPLAESLPMSRYHVCRSSRWGLTAKLRGGPPPTFAKKKARPGASPRTRG